MKKTINVLLCMLILSCLCACVAAGAAATKVTLNVTNKVLGVNESFYLKGKTNITVRGTTYTYSSANRNIAVVASNGKVIAKRTGTTRIYVRTNTGLRAFCNITVRSAPSKVTLSYSCETLKIAKTLNLRARLPSGSAGRITYKSSNASVATVSSSGIVKGIKTGKAVITATTYNGKKATCEVYVRIVDYKTAYRSFRQVQADAIALAKRYPNLIKVTSIGKSAMGQSITMLTMGNGKKKGLVVGGMHSREHITVTFSMRCIEEYAINYYSSTGYFGSYNLRTLFKNYTLYIVPSCNPDGLDIVNGAIPLFSSKKQTRDIFKRNANGVNLNRNFPFCWNRITGSTEPAHPEEGYKGRSAGSEPETKALMRLCKAQPFRWMFSMHCIGNNVYWRDSYNGDIRGAYTLVNRLRDNCGYYKSGTSTDPNLYGGGFENWFRYAFDKPGFCVELVPVSNGFDFNQTSDYKYFNSYTNFSKTRYTFIQGMLS